jgi:hypothetical protein
MVTHSKPNYGNLAIFTLFLLTFGNGNLPKSIHFFILNFLNLAKFHLLKKKAYHGSVMCSTAYHDYSVGFDDSPKSTIIDRVLCNFFWVYY